MSVRWGGIARAAVAGGTMAVALGVGTGLGEHVTRWAGVSGLVGRLVPALLTCLIAVPVVLVLRRRWDRRPLRQLGLTGVGASMRGFALGVGVTLASAITVFGAGTAAGWLRWRELDPGGLLAFVAGNGLVALLLEALPEELTMRGYAWTALRERHRAALATTVTTVVFLLVPGVSTLVTAGVAATLGGPPAPIGLVPDGEDPVSYLVLLTVFGLTLVAARTATSARSLGTCIGTHLTFLTVDRVVLFGPDYQAGWSAELATPDVVLLVPAYLLVTMAAYLAINRLRRRRRTPNPQAPRVRTA